MRKIIYFWPIFYLYISICSCAINNYDITVSAMAEGRAKKAGKIAVPLFYSKVLVQEKKTSNPSLLSRLVGKKSSSQYVIVPKKVNENWHLTDRFITALIKKGYKIVEREYINQILTEKKVNISDLFDAAKVKEIGQLVGADIIVVGENSVEDVFYYDVTKDVSRKIYSQFKKINLSFRGIRVKDGVVVFSVLVHCEKECGDISYLHKMIDRAVEKL